jgi:Carboxypeptidase regulatory-like domain
MINGCAMGNRSMKMIRLLSFLLLLGLAGSSGAVRTQAFAPAAAPLTPACYLSGGTGGIAGTVTAADTGLPIAHVNVNISTIYGNTVRSGSTDSAGRYQITGLVAGSYLIQFDPRYTGQPYLLEWYNNQRIGTIATPVVVSELAVTIGIDAVLEQGAQIRRAGCVWHDQRAGDLPHVPWAAYGHLSCGLRAIGREPLWDQLLQGQTEPGQRRLGQCHRARVAYGHRRRSLVSALPAQHTEVDPAPWAAHAVQFAPRET